MKKTINIFLIIIFTFLTFILFNFLNLTYPNNLISKIIRAVVIVLNPVLIALVLLYLIMPFTKRLIIKYRFRKKQAIVFSIITFFIITIALFSFTVLFIFEQGYLLIEQLAASNIIDNIRNWFYQNKLSGIFDLIETYIKEFDYQNMFGSINTIFSTILQAVATIVLVPIFLWHFMNLDENLENTIKDNLPTKWQDNVLPILKESNDVVSNYFRSKLISMVVLFVLFLITYSILGIPIGYVIFFSFLISVLDIIPYIGPTVGLLVPIIYIFSLGSTNILYINSLELSSITTVLLLLGINVIIQFIQGNIIIPAISGKEMNIHSGLILVFMLFFGYILGIWGIVLAIPLGGIMIVLWKRIKQTNFFTNSN